METERLEIHEIRLRGGWECRRGCDPSAEAVRQTLPTRWGPVPPGRLRLSRRFQRPPRAPDERAVLRLRQVPGVRSIRLNGMHLDAPAPSLHDGEIELGRLAPCNELVLEVEPPVDGSDWGFISLVFASGASPTDPLATSSGRLSPGEERPDGLE